MDNPIPATLADAPVKPHYSEMFADLCKRLAEIMAMATERNHQGVLKTAQVLDKANRTVYAQVMAKTVGDDGTPLTDEHRRQFVVWLMTECHKVIIQASLTQALQGNPPEGWDPGE
jgi:hypothetical protein